MPESENPYVQIQSIGEDDTWTLLCKSTQDAHRMAEWLRKNGRDVRIESAKLIVRKLASKRTFVRT